ncbi:MAG: type II toxin-antitoxin system RelE/ParE family toxin [Dermatophilus congolensis]|nr:type II toxin-antitoxin system RelE/ParE family toxin [Dermatophilus congolensis]
MTPRIAKTGVFDLWLSNLKDHLAVARLLSRIDRLAAGHTGDAKSVGGGVSELRIDHGPGYRIYFTRRGATLVVLLCGGDKATQQRDIRRARLLARDWKDDG